jgi:hypothetical protein
LREVASTAEVTAEAPGCLLSKIGTLNVGISTFFGNGPDNIVCGFNYLGGNTGLGMVQGRVTLCNAKYPTAFSAGAYSRSTCVEKRHKLCHAKCYLRTKEREPCPGRP